MVLEEGDEAEAGPGLVLDDDGNFVAGFKELAENVEILRGLREVMKRVPHEDEIELKGNVSAPGADVGDGMAFPDRKRLDDLKGPAFEDAVSLLSILRKIEVSICLILWHQSRWAARRKLEEAGLNGLAGPCGT